MNCLNPYELIRKYRCRACDGVMMCGCEERYGRRFLSHQLDQGCVLETQARVPVTLGFVAAICPECRGLPAISAPKAPAMGATSKIKRYYWRELYFRETGALRDWCEAHLNASDAEVAAMEAEISAQVLTGIKAEHAAKPKYVYADPSDHEILTRHGVTVTPLKAAYVPDGRKGAVIQDGDAAIAPELFVTRHLETQGRRVMTLESAPVIALFGVMMWRVVQDPGDELGRYVCFGDRDDFEAGRPCRQIWTQLPSDFGSPGYGERNRARLAAHFELVREAAADLPWLFETWRGPSEALRQYLWAQRAGDVDRAKRLVEILPAETIIAILQYLAENLWGRQLGWPDLLVYGGPSNDFELVEVKSSKDSLTEDQKRWIEDNADGLQLPFRIIKIHRATEPAIRGG